MTIQKRTSESFDSKGRRYKVTIVDDVDPKYPLGFKRLKHTFTPMSSAKKDFSGLYNGAKRIAKR